MAACGGAGAGAEAGRSPVQADAALLAGALANELRTARRLRGIATELRGERGRLVGRLAAGDERHAEALRAAIRRLGEPRAIQRGSAAAGGPEAGSGLQGALALAEAAARSQVELLPRLSAPEVRTLLAYILAEEAAHASALRAALGRAPVPGAFL
jgi:rubrerythrin